MGCWSLEVSHGQIVAQSQPDVRTQVKPMNTIEVELPPNGAPWIIHRVEPYLVVVVDTSLAEVRYPNAQNVVVQDKS